ncbi:HelD family protein [Corynebacterium crudilactis]|uniref:Helicase n=1 Tax=Corynebacterium crudilactis TaxID=1652495 RepID=A0A172QT75_9CORY|nr:AAA family ATPase [Corynebacterium crudilactis]ANE03909.1 helicase [Corynebacterium crudilactis]
MTTTRNSESGSDIHNAPAIAISQEQAYVDVLFGRLDDEVTRSNQRLAEVMKDVDPYNPDPEALVRRETEYHGLNQKLDRLNLAQLGLVFGRIDVESVAEDAENPVVGHPGLDRRYIGRMGLDVREDNYRTLLLDWRSPMARPFYLATTVSPEGVHMRRHIRTRGRVVTGVDDEVLSGNSSEALEQGGVGSESVLHQALEQARSGHMRNIVETIQREQDEIIRDTTRGVMVVQGGPGTGKTAVALHRVAYLLYTWRDQLAKTGVLIIGPNKTFLEYISHVLPELGETGVVLSTIGELFPGIEPTGKESALTREIKGSEEMANILAEAVKAYQVTPERTIFITVDGIEISIDEKTVAKSRTRARRARQPHNMARPIFREHLIEQLAHQMAQIIGADPLGGKNLLSAADIDQLHDDLLDDAALLTIIDDFWPELRPQDVLYDLLTSEERIDVAAAGYDEETRSSLLRGELDPWAPTDAALLDELALLVGLPDPEEAREKADAKWREQIEDAQEVLDVLSSSQSSDIDDDIEAEVLSAFDVIDAETLAQRQTVTDNRTTAQRAQADHKWAYGHVIVDEAQELSPMEWRMVFRRSPSRWMTLVGDIAQTGSPAGVDDWAESLWPFVEKRFRHHELTVNYRTPAEIMTVANKLLEDINPNIAPAMAIRESGREVLQLPIDADVDEVIQRLTEEDPRRTVAVISSYEHHRDNFYVVDDIKGLEFDHVIVLDPAGIIEESPQGLQDLYVAVTRATQSLTIIGDL